jgi:hypothetical protein
MAVKKNRVKKDDGIIMDFRNFFSCHPEVGRTPSKQFHKVFSHLWVITELWCPTVLKE